MLTILFQTLIGKYDVDDVDRGLQLYLYKLYEDDADVAWERAKSVLEDDYSISVKMNALIFMYRVRPEDALSVAKKYKDESVFIRAIYENLEEDYILIGLLRG